VKHEDKTTAALEAEIAILERKKLITEEQIAIRRRELAANNHRLIIAQGRIYVGAKILAIHRRASHQGKSSQKD